MEYVWSLVGMRGCFFSCYFYCGRTCDLFDLGSTWCLACASVNSFASVSSCASSNQNDRISFPKRLM